MRKTNTLGLLTIFILIIQFAFWHGFNSLDNEHKSIWVGTKNIKPSLEIVPDVPSKEMLKAFSFGDEELTFRYYGYIMQFIGDSFGRVTPLKDYDYAKLYRWWTLLDEVDPKSNLIAYVTAYYYAESQETMRDVPYVVKFLEEHADKAPNDSWWWYYQAAYNAKYKLHDMDNALRIAKKLADLPDDVDMPIWARQLPAFMYEGQGEYKQACDVIVKVVRDFGDNKISEGEMNFMYSFIKERLRAMIEKESTIEKADISDECRVLMEVQKAQDLKEKSKEFQKNK